MRTVKISKADSGIRLDKFLFKIMPDAPSGIIYKSLRKKRIKVNGKRTTDDTVQLILTTNFLKKAQIMKISG